MLVQVVAAAYLVLGAAALGWIVARTVYRAVLKRRRQTDAVGPVPSQPVAIVTLIHGTWARSAPWTRADSPLGVALRAAFDDRVALFRFEWTGHNRVGARERAAERLHAHLLGLADRYPDARHYVIAHSHAGNIVMYALRDRALHERLHGVVCLSTPFLHVRRRQLGAITNATIVAALVVGPWIFGGMLLQRLGVNEDLAILGSLIAGGVIAYVLVRWSRRPVEHLLRTLTLPETVVVPCLIVRGSGDEAGAALGLIQVLSWVVGLCWVAPAGVVAEVVTVIRTWGSMARRYRWYAALLVAASAAVFAVDSQYGPFLAAAGDLRSKASSIASMALAAGAATLLIWWLGSGAGLYGYALGFTVAGVVLSPLILLFALFVAPFGPELVLACVHLDITAESTPPGAWTVHHLHAPGVGERRGGGHDETYGLMHSTYASPDAIGVIVAWLLARTA
jgi:hypothetical protein